MIGEYMYAVLQIKDGKEGYLFEPFERLREHGITPTPDAYREVCTGALPLAGSLTGILNRLFEIFNMEIPEDYTGHSLSVSDIIAVRQSQEEADYYYVDRIGFRKLDGFGFYREEKNAAAETV